MLSEREAIAREPRGLTDARVGSGHTKAGDNRVVSAGHNSEEHRIGMIHHRPAGNLFHCRSGNVAEKEIRDVALENDDFAIARQDAGEHSDCALQDGNHGEHGRNAEGNARDADERADAVAAQIGHDQLEKDHGRAPMVFSITFSVTRTSSSSRSLRSFPRNDNPGLDLRSR